MDYTLHQLRIFRKIVETKSITKAAKALHLSQPAVSIQLKKLQDQFEIPLTEVIGRQLYVTDFGEEIAMASERILGEVDAIRHKAMAHKGHLTGQLKIMVASTGKYVLPFFLADFLRLHEGVEINMDVTNKGKVVESLEQNEVDFAMVSVLPEHLAIERIELMPNLLYLAGSRDLPHDPKQFDLETLQSLPLIYREAGSATRQQMEAFITNTNLPSSKRMELTSNEAVKQAVIAGLGYSILSIVGLKHELKEGSVKIIPMEGLPMRTAWNLIWLKNKKFSPAAEAYIKYVEQEKDRIIEEKFGWMLRLDL